MAQRTNCFFPFGLQVYRKACHQFLSKDRRSWGGMELGRKGGEVTEGGEIWGWYKKDVYM